MPQLVRAAVQGEIADLALPRPAAYAGEGADLCYVKGCARGIALYQLVEKLTHRTYDHHEHRHR